MKTKPLMHEIHEPGDVFQINERHGRKGWIGAFVMATEIKTWGIQGFVSHVTTHDAQQRAYIRLPWDQIDYIGKAPLQLASDVEPSHKLET